MKCCQRLIPCFVNSRNSNCGIRTQRTALLTAIVYVFEGSGPLVHFFHDFLETVVFKGKRQSSVPVVVGKMAMDQFLFSPIFTVLYFYLRALADDQSLAATTTLLKRDLLGIMKSSWMVWIPANFLNYLLIPVDLRVLFGNLVGFFWNAYLIARAP